MNRSDDMRSKFSTSEMGKARVHPRQRQNGLASERALLFSFARRRMGRLLCYGGEGGFMGGGGDGGGYGHGLWIVMLQAYFAAYGSLAACCVGPSQ